MKLSPWGDWSRVFLLRWSCRGEEAICQFSLLRPLTLGNAERASPPHPFFHFFAAAVRGYVGEREPTVNHQAAQFWWVCMEVVMSAEGARCRGKNKSLTNDNCENIPTVHVYIYLNFTIPNLNLPQGMIKTQTKWPYHLFWELTGTRTLQRGFHSLTLEWMKSWSTVRWWWCWYLQSQPG